MKKKMLFMILSIAVSVALIGGATLAWFTNEADLDPTEFTAGTVEISADGGVVSNQEKIKNVNPGDCFKLEWDIENVGTKKIELRAIINAHWVDEELDYNLNEKNIYIVPQNGSDWVFYQPEDKQGPSRPIYAYYMGGSIDGTYGSEDNLGGSSNLELVLYFDGPSTGNKYQGVDFTLDVDFEAVQASNDAPSAVWGEEGWDDVNAKDDEGNLTYSYSYESWALNGIDLGDIDCYESEEEPEVPEDPFTVTAKLRDGKGDKNPRWKFTGEITELIHKSGKEVFNEHIHVYYQFDGTLNGVAATRNYSYYEWFDADGIGKYDVSFAREYLDTIESFTITIFNTEIVTLNKDQFQFEL